MRIRVRVRVLDEKDVDLSPWSWKKKQGRDVAKLQWVKDLRRWGKIDEKRKEMKGSRGPWLWECEGLGCFWGFWMG